MTRPKGVLSGATAKESHSFVSQGSNLASLILFVSIRPSRGSEDRRDIASPTKVGILWQRFAERHRSVASDGSTRKARAMPCPTKSRPLEVQIAISGARRCRVLQQRCERRRPHSGATAHVAIAKIASVCDESNPSPGLVCESARSRSARPPRRPRGARATLTALGERARSCQHEPMGVLVTFESTRLLMQREDFPAALRALKKLAKDSSDFFHDAAGVVRCKDFASALAAAEFPGTFDEHGDLVSLRFVGDKLPQGGSDDFPDQLMVAWKKLFRDTIFDRWIEGTAPRRFWIDRGTVRSQEWAQPRRHFEQVGPVPRCRPGDRVEIAFRYLSTIEDDVAAVQVRTGLHYPPCHIEFAPRKMHPGEAASLVVCVDERADRYEEDLQFVVYGDEGNISIRGWISLTLDVEDDLDQAHAIVAIESSAWNGVYLPEKKCATALEDVLRYAARHGASPGADFLRRVASATDIGLALREAGFEPAPTHGAVRSLSFAGNRLPGSERFVIGLLRSFAALTQATGAVRLAYASSPRWWTALEFSKGALHRVRLPRPASHT